MPRWTALLTATCLLAPGCMAIHGISGSGTPGEFYVTARRSFLVFNGRQFVVRCQERDLGAGPVIGCERILEARDLKSLAPVQGKTTTYPGSTFFSTGTGWPAPTSATGATSKAAEGLRTDEPALNAEPATPEAILAAVYSALHLPRPDEAVAMRDLTSVAWLVSMGQTEAEVVSTILATRRRIRGTMTVSELVAQTPMGLLYGTPGQ